jgi:hypothetical protein
VGVWLHHVPAVEAQVVVGRVLGAVFCVDTSPGLPCVLCVLHQCEGGGQVGGLVRNVPSILQEVGTDGIQHHLIAILSVCWCNCYPFRSPICFGVKQITPAVSTVNYLYPHALWRYCPQAKYRLPAAHHHFPYISLEPIIEGLGSTATNNCRILR